MITYRVWWDESYVDVQSQRSAPVQVRCCMTYLLDFETRTLEREQIEEDTYRYCTGRKETRKLGDYKTLGKELLIDERGTDISRTSSSLDLRLDWTTALS